MCRRVLSETPKAYPKVIALQTADHFWLLSSKALKYLINSEALLTDFKPIHP